MIRRGEIWVKVNEISWRGVNLDGPSRIGRETVLDQSVRFHSELKNPWPTDDPGLRWMAFMTGRCGCGQGKNLEVRACCQLLDHSGPGLSNNAKVNGMRGLFLSICRVLNLLVSYCREDSNSGGVKDELEEIHDDCGFEYFRVVKVKVKVKDSERLRKPGEENKGVESRELAGYARPLPEHL
jgi:hypothetical protein